MSKFLCICIFLFATSGFAIDNPDTIDYVGQFNARAKPFEQNIANRAGAAAAEISGLYTAYYLFLDEELNSAYNSLLKKLPKTEQKKLKSSQKSWLTFRTNESEFIVMHWTQSQSGSSAALSVGVYKSEITRQRIIHLLNYLKN